MFCSRRGRYVPEFGHIFALIGAARAVAHRVTPVSPAARDAMSDHTHAEGHASPPRHTRPGRPAQESPGTLRGTPGSASVARQRLGDLTNHAPPRPTPDGSVPSPTLQRYRNIVTPAWAAHGENGLRTETPQAAIEPPQAVGVSVVSAASHLASGTPATTPSPSVLMSHLSVMLSRSSGSAGRLQPFVSAHASSSSHPITGHGPPCAPCAMPPLAPPRAMRKCCACHEEKTSIFRGIPTSWLKAAFVLLGRPFPGCFGTTSKACQCTELPVLTIRHADICHVRR